MKKIIILNTGSFTLLLLLTMVSFNSCGQNFVYKPIPIAYLPTINPTYLSEVQNYKSTTVDLTQYLPLNFVKDGSVDYTTQLQNGLKLNKVVLMPNFPILTTGINAASNSTIIFQKKSKLLMVPSKREGYNILEIRNVHDVNVYFANIVGDRKEHLGSTGEWGFGIGIISAYNIKIINPSISDCWGDGIYINNMSSKEQDQTNGVKSNNILIDGANLDNNRRNGLSLIDGKDITIKNSVLSNTNGTSPMAGLDIEPNNGHGELTNVILDSVVTFNNRSSGILIVLGAFQSEKQKAVKLTIDSCIDDGAPYGMIIAFGRKKDDDLIYAGGNINVIAPIWKNNTKGEIVLPFYGSKNTVKLNIHNAKVYKNGKLLTSEIKPINLTKAPNISIK